MRQSSLTPTCVAPAATPRLQAATYLSEYGQPQSGGSQVSWETIISIIIGLGMLPSPIVMLASISHGALAAGLAAIAGIALYLYSHSSNGRDEERVQHRGTHTQLLPSSIVSLLGLRIRSQSPTNATVACACARAKPSRLVALPHSSPLGRAAALRSKEGWRRRTGSSAGTTTGISSRGFPHAQSDAELMM